MEKIIIQNITKYVGYLERILNNQQARLDDLKVYEALRLKERIRPSGKKYYYYKTPAMTKYKYFGTEANSDVAFVKEARYYAAAIPKIKTNLSLCRRLIDNFTFTDFDSINTKLPLVYQDAELRIGDGLKRVEAASWKAEKEAYKESCGPWFPEDLKVTTADRKKVRSKSEGLIYNHMFWQNITFVYELPVQLINGITRHPDFTVLSEIDWASTVLIDHEGMYGFEEDRKRYNNDMYLYWQSGYIPGVNIFFTFDDPHGGFDLSTIQNILETKIRPA